jgi:hypothetical protein
VGGLFDLNNLTSTWHEACDRRISFAVTTPVLLPSTAALTNPTTTSAIVHSSTYASTTEMSVSHWLNRRPHPQRFPFANLVTKTSSPSRSSSSIPSSSGSLSLMAVPTSESISQIPPSLSSSSIVPLSTSRSSAGSANVLGCDPYSAVYIAAFVGSIFYQR